MKSSKSPGYTATDDSGNDITADVSVSDASLNKAGEQKIEYEVKDSKGSTTRVTRTITVEPNTDYDTPGLPICMYHYVYDENDPPADLARGSATTYRLRLWKRS
ncbi:MAG: immunoglobulin-like domain-containing protein [Anaerovoracaceae bacterium]